MTVSAPFAGTLLPPASGGVPPVGSAVSAGQPLLRLAALPPDRDLARELVVARVRLDQAQREADRATRLSADRLISTRDYERAQADLVAARAAFETLGAQNRLASGTGSGTDGVTALVISAPARGTLLSMSALPGQTVAAGATLAYIVALDRLWVRVPTYAGDARQIDQRGEAAIRLLNGEMSATSKSMRGTPVTAPPTADPIAASIDLYYAVSGAGTVLRPGQRVSVTVPLNSSLRHELAIPLTALVHDTYGGAWVYERVDSVTFVRRRIEVSRIAGRLAVLSRGPAVGTVIVVAGVAELFGIEFGPGK